MNRRLSITFAGAGTACYWALEAFSRCSAGRAATRVAIVDCARIRDVNAVTCPKYAGEIGRLKSERLAELAARWFPRGSLEVVWFGCEVEELDWAGLLGGAGRGADQAAIAVLGLDNWPSRLNVCEDLRSVRSSGVRGGRTRQIPMIQIGLDRDEASVAIFGSRWEDPCPGCGKRVLPEAAPCVYLTAKRELARGDLHAEARAAGSVAARMASRFLAGAVDAINVKVNLFRLPGTSRFRGLARPARRVSGCSGPHNPETPVRWDGILEPLDGRRDFAW